MRCHPKESMNKKTTTFGFKKVLTSEKAKLVADVFSSVASRYDLMNDLMSLGIHRRWKNTFVHQITQASPCMNNFVDVGGGTGDIAFKLKQNRPSADAYVVDINHAMLLAGKSRAIDVGLFKQINWIRANAEVLPFKDATFDVYVTAFCFRNITNLGQALAEAYRVLKPGGKFFCLEFSKVDNSILNFFYKVWSFQVIPKLGRLVTKNESAYQYLVESIDRFYTAEAFKALIEQAGFLGSKFTKLSQGITAIHSGVKPVINK